MLYLARDGGCGGVLRISVGGGVVRPLRRRHRTPARARGSHPNVDVAELVAAPAGAAGLTNKGDVVGLAPRPTCMAP